MHLVFVIGIGWLLSFLGQLPLGIMSFTATQIAVQENFREAWKYSLGVTLIEILYLRLVLAGMQWIMNDQTLVIIAAWVSSLLFLVLGVLSLIAARNQEREKKALLLENRVDRFLLGLSMSALNPVQIPFWFIWSSYFIGQHWILPGFSEFNWFSAGAGLGTLAGLILYMYGGNWLVARMKTSKRMLNQIMGLIFIAAALAQIFRMISRHTA